MIYSQNNPKKHSPYHRRSSTQAFFRKDSDRMFIDNAASTEQPCTLQNTLSSGDSSLKYSFTVEEELVPDRIPAPTSQLAYINRQLLRNVSDWVISASNQAEENYVLESLHQIISQISDMQLSNKSLVQQNTRLLLANRETQAQLTKKERTLQALNTKLSKIIDQVDQHQQTMTVNLLTELSQILGGGRMLTAQSIKVRVIQMMNQCDRLVGQVEYLEKLLMGRKHSQCIQLQKAILKMGKAMVQKDQLQIKLHDLGLQNIALKDQLTTQSSRILELSTKSLSNLDKATTDIPDVPPSPRTQRCSNEQVWVPSPESQQLLLVKLSKMQELNKQLAQKLSQMATRSDSLINQLQKQLEQVQAIKSKTTKRQQEFQQQLKMYQQQMQTTNSYTRNTLIKLQQQLKEKQYATQRITQQLVAVKQSKLQTVVLLQKSKQTITKLQQSLQVADKTLRGERQKYEDLKVNSQERISKLSNLLGVRQNQINALNTQFQKPQKNKPDSEEPRQQSSKQLMDLNKRIQEYQKQILPELFKQLQSAQQEIIKLKHTQTTQQQQELTKLTAELQQSRELVKSEVWKRMKLETQLEELKAKVIQLTEANSSHNPKDCLEQREQLKSILLQLEDQITQLQYRNDDLQIELARIKGTQPKSTRSRIKEQPKNEPTSQPINLPLAEILAAKTD